MYLLVTQVHCMSFSSNTHLSYKKKHTYTYNWRQLVEWWCHDDDHSHIKLTQLYDNKNPRPPPYTIKPLALEPKPYTLNPRIGILFIPHPWISWESSFSAVFDPPQSQNEPLLVPEIPHFLELPANISKLEDPWNHIHLTMMLTYAHVWCTHAL